MIHCLATRSACLSLAIAFFTIAATAADAQQSEPSKADFFERRIRPVLVEHCYQCHSTKATVLEGGLRLDTRELARRGGDSGPAIVPGHPEASVLLSALRYESLEMPPDKKLPDRVIADFERWIRQGAIDPRDDADAVPTPMEDGRHHWAFQPVHKPTPPTTINQHWPRGAIDRFVLKRLEDEGLKPSIRADRRSLIRRAYFDLIGLPPEPDEIDRFVADDSPVAFRQLVDRLLDSPHYGERWARHWLDVARYADNKGYVFYFEKSFPWAWTYRDYVIRAFNEDLPFDRFIVEQLAADQLHLGDDQRALTAMGFLTVGARFINNAHDVIDDRIDVVTRGLMGLTVSCARCHDHKYDPVTQADYYSLYGVFRSSFEPTVLPTFEPTAKTKEVQEFETGLAERLAKLSSFVEVQRLLVIKEARSRIDEYLTAAYETRRHPNTDDFMLLTEKGAIIPVMVQRWQRYLRRMRDEGDHIWLIWHALAELPDEGFAERAATLQQRVLEEQGEFIHPRIREEFASTPPSSMADVISTYARIFREIDSLWQMELRLAADSNTVVPQRMEDEYDEQLRQVLYGQRSPPMIPRQFDWGFLQLLPDRANQEEFKKLLKDVEQWTMTQPGAPARAMVLHDREELYEPVVFLRGNPNRRGPQVPRQFPAILSTDRRRPFAHGSGRLELAKAITDPANPLTARVIVNRVWQHHFGTGIVETASDFGVRSPLPSHPLLLDWLAATFIEDGWSIKQLHRRIMNSAVYQQTSTRHGSTQQLDPANRWLWKFPRRRLEFEAMRDSMLAVTSQMDRTIGGAPANLLKEFVPRRTIYGFVDRMDLPVTMRTFDFPTPNSSNPGREATTVPPQALYFLNHEFVHQCAERITERVDVRQLTATGARIDRIYRILLGRLPDDTEKELARQYLEFAPNESVSGSGEPETDRWVGFVHAMIMTNEFLFID